MGIKVNLGSEFISITYPKDKPWIRKIYFGNRDGTGNHGHISASGSIVLEPNGTAFAETWFFRDTNNNTIVKNANPLLTNTSQLLSDCIPDILKGFQHPEQSLFWNVGNLDSFFLSQKKYPQL